MSKLVDKERLAKLAQALDARMKAAVKAEKERAMSVEADINAQALLNKAAIEAINNEQTGILAQAKNHCDSVKDELKPMISAKVSQEEYNAKVLELANKDTDMAEDILGLDTAVKAIEAKMGDGDLNLPAINNAINSFKEAQLEIDAAQDTKVASLEEAVFGKEGGKAGLEAEMDAVEGRVLAIENANFQKQIDDEEAARAEEDQRLAGLIEGIDGRVQTVEQFKTTHEGQYSEIQGKVKALEDKFVEGGEVDGKVSDVQEAVDELKDAYEEFVAAQEVKEQAQDDAIAGKVEQSVYDEKVQALVDKDAELNKAIVDEAAAARAAEQGLGQRIDAIVDEETGIEAVVKAYADEKVEAEKGLREDADEALQGQIDDINEAAEELEARVKANEDKLAVVQGADNVEGSIAKAEKDAKDYADEKIAALVDSAPEAMNTLNELAKAISDHGDVYEGYVAEHALAMAQQKADLQKEIDDDIAAAKVLISEEIDADVKAEADRAKAEEADIRADFAADDAALKAELQAEIDADVKVEKDRAEAAEKAIGERIDGVVEQVGKDIAAAVLEEQGRAQGEEERIEAAYKLADQGLSGRIADLEALMGQGGEEGEGNALDVIRGRLDVAEDEIDDLQAADVEMNAAIALKADKATFETKVQALEAADEAMDGRMDAVEGFVEGHDHTAMVNDITALKEFQAGHSHAAMEADITQLKKDVVDNKKHCDDEMAKEVEARDAAIAKALEAYTTSDEMKVMLGSIVNSLALSFEDNKMMLKLGGAEGITIHETSLDMATDDDITAIINGLDA